MLDSRPKGRGFEPHLRHCVVSLSKNINPSLVYVHPRKTRPFITEKLLIGRKESNKQTKTVTLQEDYEMMSITGLGNVKQNLDVFAGQNQIQSMFGVT